MTDKRYIKQQIWPENDRPNFRFEHHSRILGLPGLGPHTPSTQILCKIIDLHGRHGHGHGHGHGRGHGHGHAMAMAMATATAMAMAVAME